MKKIVIVFIALILICTLIAGCTKNESETANDVQSFMTEINSVDKELKNAMICYRKTFSHEVPVHKWYSNIRSVDSTLGGLKYKVDNIKIDENLPEETKKTLKAIKSGYSDGIGSYLKAIRIVEDALGNDTDINTKDVYEMQSNFSKGHVALELSSIPLTELHEKYNIDIPNANQY